MIVYQCRECWLLLDSEQMLQHVQETSHLVAPLREKKSSAAAAWLQEGIDAVEK